MAPRQKQADQQEFPWDTKVGIHVRLLRAREAMRNATLWKSFEGETRDYEAFSIHQLAEVVELELAKVGVTCHFDMKQCTISGQWRNVEGWCIFTCAERDGDEYNVGDQLRVFTVGEAWDQSDKGIGKAVSYARKNGMICGLNLSIGRDNESSRDKPDQPPEPTVASATAGTIPIIMGGRTYNLQRSEMFDRISKYIMTLQNAVAIAAFRDENAGAFGLFWQSDQQQAFAIKKTIEARIQALQEAAQGAK